MILFPNSPHFNIFAQTSSTYSTYPSIFSKLSAIKVLRLRLDLNYMMDFQSKLHNCFNSIIEPTSLISGTKQKSPQRWIRSSYRAHYSMYILCFCYWQSWGIFFNILFLKVDGSVQRSCFVHRCSKRQSNRSNATFRSPFPILLPFQIQIGCQTGPNCFPRKDNATKQRGLYRVTVGFRYEMNAKRLQHLQIS